MRDMTLKEASNIAWHVRVNGLDGVMAENLKGAFAVLEKLADREPLVTALIECAFECDGNATHKAAERVRDFEPK